MMIMTPILLSRHFKLASDDEAASIACWSTCTVARVLVTVTGAYNEASDIDGMHVLRVSYP